MFTLQITQYILFAIAFIFTILVFLALKLSFTENSKSLLLQQKNLKLFLRPSSRLQTTTNQATQYNRVFINLLMRFTFIQIFIIRNGRFKLPMLLGIVAIFLTAVLFSDNNPLSNSAYNFYWNWSLSFLSSIIFLVFQVSLQRNQQRISEEQQSNYEVQDYSCTFQRKQQQKIKDKLSTKARLMVYGTFALLTSILLFSIPFIYTYGFVKINAFSIFISTIIAVGISEFFAKPIMLIVVSVTAHKYLIDLVNRYEQMSKKTVLQDKIKNQQLKIANAIIRSPPKIMSPGKIPKANKNINQKQQFFKLQVNKTLNDNIMNTGNIIQMDSLVNIMQLSRKKSANNQNKLVKKSRIMLNQNLNLSSNRCILNSNTTNNGLLLLMTPQKSKQVDDYDTIGDWKNHKYQTPIRMIRAGDGDENLQKKKNNENEQQQERRDFEEYSNNIIMRNINKKSQLKVSHRLTNKNIEGSVKQQQLFEVEAKTPKNKKNGKTQGQFYYEKSIKQQKKQNQYKIQEEKKQTLGWCVKSRKKQNLKIMQDQENKKIPKKQDNNIYDGQIKQSRTIYKKSEIHQSNVLKKSNKNNIQTFNQDYQIKTHQVPNQISFKTISLFFSPHNSQVQEKAQNNQNQIEYNDKILKKFQSNNLKNDQLPQQSLIHKTVYHNQQQLRTIQHHSLKKSHKKNIQDSLKIQNQVVKQGNSNKKKVVLKKQHQIFNQIEQDPYQQSGQYTKNYDNTIKNSRNIMEIKDQQEARDSLQTEDQKMPKKHIQIQQQKSIMNSLFFNRKTTPNILSNLKRQFQQQTYYDHYKVNHHIDVLDGDELPKNTTINHNGNTALYIHQQQQNGGDLQQVDLNSPLKRQKKDLQKSFNLQIDIKTSPNKIKSKKIADNSSPDKVFNNNLTTPNLRPNKRDDNDLRRFMNYQQNQGQDEDNAWPYLGSKVQSQNQGQSIIQQYNSQRPRKIKRNGNNANRNIKNRQRNQQLPNLLSLMGDQELGSRQQGLL